MNKRLEILNTVLLVAILVVGVTMMLAVNNDGKIGARTANPTTLDADEWTQVNDLAVDDLEVQDDVTIGGDVDITASLTCGEFTQGGGVLTIATSTGTTVLTQAQLANYNVLELMVNTGATATFTLPATSTLTTLIPNAGDFRSWVLHNATSSTMALTVGAGTGIDLIGYTTNDDVIDATEYSQLECFRQTDTDVTCITSELLHVD